MSATPWWSPARLAALSEDDRPAAMARVVQAVEYHMTLRTSTDDLARRRAARWLREHGLAALVDADVPD